MYKKNNLNKTSISRNESYIGERIEEKIARMINNKEPISDTAPLIYTERKDGVKPEFDIRTDRWTEAVKAMGTVDKTHKANREKRIGEKTYDTMSNEEQAAFDKKFPTNKHAMNKAKNENKGESGA